MLSSYRTLMSASAWPRRSCLALLLAGALATLSACGGGTNTAQNNNNGGVGSGGTGSYTNGPISGLGSIIVNGIEYALDSSTTVVSDDDTAAAGSAADLKLGMVVEVQGSAATVAATATTNAQANAKQVRYASDLIGTVTVTTSGTPAVSSYAVLGQTIATNAKTIMPAMPLVSGDTVAVYGLADAATGVYTATRIDRVTPMPSRFKLAGVATLDTMAYTITIGTANPVSYADLRLQGKVPDGLRTGQRVRVWFGAAQTNGQWVATQIKLDQALVQDSDEASLEGVLTSVATATSTIVIDGKTVDVNGLSAGIRSTLTQNIGQRVRVEGALRDGVLVATELEVRSMMDVDDQEAELHGSVSNYTTVMGNPDVIATFVVRGVTVAINAATQREGDVSLTAPQVCVEVTGKRFNSQGQLIALQYEGEACRND